MLSGLGPQEGTSYRGSQSEPPRSVYMSAGGAPGGGVNGGLQGRGEVRGVAGYPPQKYIQIRGRYT